MIELLEPRHYNKPLIEELREMNKPFGLDWAIRDNEHYILDYSWIIDKLPPPDKSLKILDAGCGDGALQFWCHDRYDTQSIDRIDYSIKIHRRNAGIRFSCSGLDSTKFSDNTFDYIVSCSALEHNDPLDIPNIMSEMKRILKPGGKIIFTILARGELLYNSGNWWSFSDITINQFFIVPGMKLLSDFNNWGDFREVYFNRFLPYFKTQPYPYMPMGVILEKIC